MTTKKEKLRQQNAENLKSFLLRVADDEPRLTWDVCLSVIEIITHRQIERNFVRRLVRAQSLN